MFASKMVALALVSFRGFVIDCSVESFRLRNLSRLCTYSCLINASPFYHATFIVMHSWGLKSIRPQELWLSIYITPEALAFVSLGHARNIQTTMDGIGSFVPLLTEVLETLFLVTMALGSILLTYTALEALALPSGHLLNIFTLSCLHISHRDT